jgi:holo-[acyl-carrier protein] synthase
LIERFLNDDEIILMNNLSSEERIDFISGRWASKESIIKASNKEIIFTSISILKAENGKPVVKIDGEIRDDIKISISHEKEYTVAFSIIE